MAGWSCPDRDLMIWDGTLKANNFIINGENLDDRYVNISGDTMTGDLTIGTASEQVKINFSSYFASPAGSPNKIDLLGGLGLYGFGVESGAISYVAGDGGSHKFYDLTDLNFTIGDSTSAHDAHSHIIQNVSEPVALSDVATKNYVDEVKLGSLGDVTFTGLANGDVIYRSGGQWINLAKPSTTDTYYLENSTDGVVNWALQTAALTPSWSTVLSVGGNTSGGGNPTLTTTDKLNVRDSAIYINSPTDGDLDIVADDKITLTGASVSMPNSANWKIGALSGAQASHTGNTTETVLATITIPAGTLGANGAFRLWWTNDGTNSANTKTFRVRINGLGSTVLFSSGGLKTSTVVNYFLNCSNRNSASSQIAWGGGNCFVNGGASSSLKTDTINTGTTALNVVITVQLANSAETGTLEYYMLEYTKGVVAWE